MRRELSKDARLTFQCGHHKVDLDPTEGGAYLVLYHPTELREVPPGSSAVVIKTEDPAERLYELDLSFMSCPATGPTGPDDSAPYLEGEETLDWCVIHWRTWVVE